MGDTEQQDFQFFEQGGFNMNEAVYFEHLQNDRVKCLLCPRECIIGLRQRGYCRAKENRDGILYSTIYAQVSSLALDPIEKKPLYHFYPGAKILSVGTLGCNLSCQFCQNWHIAQKESATREVRSEELVRLALEQNSIGIAFTYSEPLVWYEYILDTAQLTNEVGLKNVLVTNGMIQEDPLRELLQYIDGINLDVKAFNQEFYHDICGGGDIETVKRTAEIAFENSLLEVTTLLIPGLNDDPKEIRELACWLSGISPEIPLHLSRYFPQFLLDLSPTPLESLLKAKKIAKEYLHYVYLGNVPFEDLNTYCHCCHYPVIKRSWNVKVDLLEGLCPECGSTINIRI